MKRITDLCLTDFRGFYGTHPIPTAGDFVLVHGQNGTGKTSILQALEFAYTGDVADLKRYGDDYPRCLESEGGKHGLTVSLTGEGNTGQTVDFTRTLAKADREREPPGQAEKKFFRDHANLSQPRLWHLLELYNQPERAGSEHGNDPLLVAILRELLGLHVADNIQVGLHVNDDRRRLIKASPHMRDLDKRLREIEQRKTEVDRLCKEAMTRWEYDTKRLSDLAGTLLGDNAPDTLQDTSEVRELLAQIKATFPENPDPQAIRTSGRWIWTTLDQLDHYRGSLNSDLPQSQTLIEQKVAEVDQRIDHERRILFTDLSNTLSELSSKDWSQYTYGRKTPERDTYRLIEELRSEDNLLNSSIADLSKKLSRQHAIQKELQQYAEQQTDLDATRNRLQKGRSRQDFLEGALKHVESTNVCPVCDRDFSEASQVTLQEHVSAELRRLGSDISALQEDLDRQSDLQQRERLLWQELTTLKSQLGDQGERLTRIKERQASVQSAISKLKGYLPQAEGLTSHLRFRETLMQQYSVVGPLESHTTYLLENLQSIHETYNSFLPEQLPMDIESRAREIARRIDALADEEWQSQSLREDLKNSCNSAIETAQSISDHQRDLDAISDEENDLQARYAKVNRTRDIARSVKAVSERAEDQIVNDVIDADLNGLWLDMFSRMARSEPYVPRLLGMQRWRGKATAAYETKSNMGDGFVNPSAILSTGNLNTAALSLFLSLNLIHAAPVQTVVLDDPVQNMDDIHSIELANILKQIRARTNRQFVLATHDYGLFEYLRSELHPVKPGQTLSVIETYRNDGGSQVEGRLIPYQEESVRTA